MTVGVQECHRTDCVTLYPLLLHLLYYFMFIFTYL